MIDDGTYNYSVGQTINGLKGGYYYIYGASGASGNVVGSVAISSYYDANTGQTYTPLYDSINGTSPGLGLGNDRGCPELC